MKALPADWSEFLRLLSTHRVRFLIVGAHALAANGRPRATQDLDVFVEPTPVNAGRLGRALAAFGFGALADAAMAFAEPDRMATLGREPLRIDIMTSITGVTFREAWKGRLRGDFGGVEVGFLAREQLVRNKRAAGRTKDLLDIALLEEADEAGTTEAPATAPPAPRPRRSSRKPRRS